MVIVDKPAGFHCHPPENINIKISQQWNGLKILEQQFKKKLYPAHRLDRATSGIYLLSKNPETASKLQSSLLQGKKIYAAVIRGSLGMDKWIETPLKSEDGEFKPAKSFFHPITEFQLPILDHKGNPRTFSIIQAQIFTGRFHQIRRHAALVSVPIIGDKRHGDKKINRAFNSLTNLNRMYLRAMKLQFIHPITQQKLYIRANWTKDWHLLFDKIEKCPIL